jgi:formate dehydrogenase gamma subunit
MSTQRAQYPRFRLGARIEHVLLLLSFTALAITGLPQMFAETPIGTSMIDLLGGIETVRIMHRSAAFLLIIGSVYHLLTSSYRFFVKRERMGVLPDLKDVRDVGQKLAFDVGVRDEHPKMRKFNFGEKFEYWAVVWGTGVMIITGFMLLNPIATTELLPGQVIPAALIAHGYEAVLAVSAIIIWHLYSVLVKHFNASMFTGRLPRKQMEEEHALEMERIDAGGRPWPELDLPTLRHRQRIFIVASLVVMVVALAFVVWMFTFEETAITTIPQVTQEVFVPLATPIP